MCVIVALKISVGMACCGGGWMDEKIESLCPKEFGVFHLSRSSRSAGCIKLVGSDP